MGTESTELRMQILGDPHPAVLWSFLLLGDLSLEACNISSVGKGHCQVVAKQQPKSCGSQKKPQCFVLFKLTF